MVGRRYPYCIVRLEVEVEMGPDLQLHFIPRFFCNNKSKYQLLLINILQKRQ